ncbi:MAG: type I-E CRISPR-associated protein Cse1/CasA [Actinobacteria bacterium]|nr:type I-E CRISPR-associated protein Cse1/CasA [Actinomycetota bacterium]
MTEGSFNLVADPWIRVRGVEGVRDVSLRDCFRQAHGITSLAGELVTQDVAILRLLLAILHRSVAGRPGSAVAVWRGLWEAPVFPQDIDTYLDEVVDRFNLFDVVAPFLQVAGLSAGKTSGLVKLVADVPDGERFFTTRAGPELDSLSLPEAARWLVHAQAFDPSGIKTGMHGDPRVKGGKGYPIGTGWVGRCGLVIAEGATLKETLLLNLVLGRGESDADPDLPVWERPPLGPEPERRHPEPLGPVDLLTWPARRIRLLRSPDQPDRVSDVLLGNGDRLEVQNRQHLEFMSGWRRSPNQEKTHGTPTYMPRSHDPSRRLWRGMAGVLAQEAQAGSVRTEPPAQLPPQVISWLARLAGQGLATDVHVRLHAVGISYGTQDASIDSIYDDFLDMQVAVATDPVLRQTVIGATRCAEDAVWQAVGQLGANLAAAAGRAIEGPRERAREAGYDRLRQPYAEWLSRLGPGSDPDAAMEEWQKAVRSVLLPLGDELVARGGQAALFGRAVGGRHVDSGLASLWFVRALRTVLPLAFPATSKEAVDV